MNSKRGKRLLLGLLSISFFLASQAQANAPLTRACAEKVLKRMGWELTEPDSTTDSTMKIDWTDLGSRACREGAPLQATLPVGQEEQFLYSMANRCAYGRQLKPAIRTAMEKIIANPGFAFQGFEGKFFRVPYSWKKYGPYFSLGTGKMAARPRKDAAKAVESFYSRSFGVDCAVGRMALELASQYELYGEQAFREAFTREEIPIGFATYVYGLGGSLMYSMNDQLDPNPRPFVEAGELAWIGLSGRINSVFDRSFLDSPVNSGENFVVLSVSESAHRQVLADPKGPISTLNRLARELWGASVELRKTTLGGEVQASLTESVLMGKARIDEEKFPLLGNEDAARILRMREIFESPAFREIRVYIHQLKERNFAWHLAHLLRVNPRTPFDFKLYNLEGADRFFRRYVDQLRRTECEGIN